MHPKVLARFTEVPRGTIKVGGGPWVSKEDFMEEERFDLALEERSSLSDGLKMVAGSRVECGDLSQRVSGGIKRTLAAWRGVLRRVKSWLL